MPLGTVAESNYAKFIAFKLQVQSDVWTCCVVCYLKGTFFQDLQF